MPGITTGTGLFSGIDTATLIGQLMAVEARPKQQIQLRVQTLQFQQGAFLDLNSRLSALKTAAASFRIDKTFAKKTSTSSDEDVLTATASTSATAGSYTFIVDRLVSTQQLLSRGFANKDSAAVGATSLTFESTKARLDRDVSLSELNGGQGVSRGKIVITDSGGAAATVDLSRTVTVGEVLEAINTNGTARVTASVQGGRLVIKDTAAGGGTMTIGNATGYTTATSLGIAASATGGTISGSEVYTLTGTTPLSALNDGNGVGIKSVAGTGAYSFSINVGGVASPVRVNLGDVYTTQGTDVVKTEGAVTTLEGALTRINAALTTAGVSGVEATIDASNGRLLLTDSTGTQPLTVTENGGTTARDLGLTTTPVGGSIQGRRLFAGLNTTLATGLNGGAGVTGDGVLNITTRDGNAFSVTIDTTASLTDIFAQIETAAGVGTNGRSRLSIGLDAKGTGFTITDNTGGADPLIIEGTLGQDTALSLGISTGASGVAAATKASGNLQRQYMSMATTVGSLNNGRGIGTGKFLVTDSFGLEHTYDIGSDTLTIADLINEINSGATGGANPVKILARINATGDGVEIIEDTAGGPAGTRKIKIKDVTGTVAKSLNLAGEATGTDAANKINGSFERTVTLSAADTLQQVADKINAAKVGTVASIINDGSTLTPFRLNLSSSSTGEAGRFIFDSQGANFSFSTLDVGQNSRVFYGATDAARAVAVTSTTNTVDTLVPGVKIDLKAASTEAVTLNVVSDNKSVVDGIKGFVSAFNTVLDRINAQMKYDATTQKSGPLAGDGTALELKATLYSVLNTSADNITSQFDQLTEIGLKVGTGGKLELNEDKFREALAQDPAGVEALFSARVQSDDSIIDLGDGASVRNPNSGRTFSSLGVMGKFEQMVEKYLDTVDGILTLRGKGLETQIKLQNDRITFLDVRLAAKEETLRRQFLAMEQAIGQLQSQSSALGSIGVLR